MENSELVVYIVSGRDIKQVCSNWVKKRWKSTGEYIKEKGTVFRDDWESKE